MKFIKVKNTNGENVIINLSSIDYFFSSSKDETTICFTGSDDYVRVAISIDCFHQGLNAMDGSYNVWDYS